MRKEYQLFRRLKALEEAGAMDYRVYENAKIELRRLGLPPDQYEAVCIRLAEACGV